MLQLQPVGLVVQLLLLTVYLTHFLSSLAQLTPTLLRLLLPILLAVLSLTTLDGTEFDLYIFFLRDST